MVDPWRMRPGCCTPVAVVVTRVPADQLDQVLAPIFDRKAIAAASSIATGLPAGPGAATGRIYFNADRAVEAAEKGPASYGRRGVRRKAYRTTNGALGKLLRGILKG